jgi:hypothetical protein
MAVSEMNGKPDRTLTALRSLEVALHPNTGECEVLAAVSAWRRVTDGNSLEAVCRTRWDKRTSEGMGLAEYRTDWADRFNEQQQRYVSQTGEIAALREKVRIATEALVALECEASALRKQVGKGLPAIRDPDAPPPEEKTSVFPLGHTELIYAEFGGTFWDNPTWNGTRLNMAKELLAQGIKIDALNTCMKGVVEGERTSDGYRYHEALHISIKNQNTTEIFRDLMRAHEQHAIPFKVVLHSTNKERRQTGKAGGKHSRGAAFPGCKLTLEPLPPTSDENPTPSD